MALDDFALLVKLLDLDVETHRICKKFEKSEKHVLSAEIRQTVALLEHSAIRAAKVQLEERRHRQFPATTLKILRDMDVELEYFKLQLRKAYALRQVSEGGFARWADQALEVGRMLGAWIKQLESRKPDQAPRQQNLLG